MGYLLLGGVVGLLLAKLWFLFKRERAINDMLRSQINKMQMEHLILQQQSFGMKTSGLLADPYVMTPTRKQQ